jgi:two-component system OmpR family response regulator
MATVCHVLFVEDDVRLARFTAQYLAERDMAVICAASGEAGLSHLAHRSFDVVILDIMLPGRDGFAVCRAIRDRSKVPILMVTARGEEADRVLGLELGADDYLVKPFSVREMVARIHALIRRASGHLGLAQQMIVAGRLSLDPSSLRVSLDGRQISLTTAEFQLLRTLIERRGRVLSREQLLELVEGTAEDSFDRAIDVRISRIRQKLGDDPKRPTLIRTIRGAGYLYPAEDEAS